MSFYFLRNSRFPRVTKRGLVRRSLRHPQLTLWPPPPSNPCVTPRRRREGSLKMEKDTQRTKSLYAFPTIRSRRMFPRAAAQPRRQIWGLFVLRSAWFVESKRSSRRDSPHGRSFLLLSDAQKSATLTWSVKDARGVLAHLDRIWSLATWVLLRASKL